MGGGEREPFGSRYGKRQSFVKTSVIGWFHKRHEVVGEISDGHPLKKELSLLRITF